MDAIYYFQVASQTQEVMCDGQGFSAITVSAYDHQDAASMICVLLDATGKAHKITLWW